ncbi:hypothetical protein ACFSHR_18670 [Azotobacter chroococcum]
MDALPTTTTAAVLDRDGLQALIEALAARGFRVLGPLVRDEAIVYDEIAGVADLPAGWTDRQGPGQYRLERRDDQALFGFAAAPQSWKRFLHPPVETLWRVRQERAGCSSAPPPRRRPDTPFSACAPATSMPSPSRTGCSARATIAMTPTRAAGAAPSSSR